MEFPELGQHCAEQACKQLDFLPLKCDMCERVFCKLHFAYASHSCPHSYKKQNLVPACPLCTRPIPVSPGEDANTVVSRHMDTDCGSEPAKKHRRRANKCSATGCRTRELVPVTCPRCRLNYCLKHRLEQDHNCAGFQAFGRAVSNAGAAAAARQQQQQQQQQQKKQQQLRQPSPNSLREAQRGLSDHEALQLAMRMSAAEVASSSGKSEAEAAEQRRRQEEFDRQLAESLQASERGAAAGQPQRQQQQQQSSDGTNCTVS